MKSAARPVLAALRGRYYSAQAASEQAAQRVTLAKQEPRVSKLPNGVVVASVEDNLPLARVALVYNAGSRYEPAESQGITHCLRSAANLSSTDSSAFGITRNIQQIGSGFNTTTTREHVMYSFECLRDSVETGIEFVGKVATKPAFQTWEVDSLSSRVATDLAMYNADPAARVVEALHSGAYRDTLGRSLYMPEHKVGKFSPQDLTVFVGTHYVPSNMAVIGSGVDHDEFVFHLQQTFKWEKDTPKVVPPKAKAVYHGGETRIDTNDQLVHAAVVTEGATLGSKDMLPLAVLQRVMGTGPYIKYSTNNATSKLNQAVSKSANSPFSASCLNMNYSDSGLFGFYVVGYYKEMGNILKGLTAEFANATKGNITSDEIARAKVQLKAAVHMELESGSNGFVDMATQVMVSGQVLKPADITAAIDAVTLSDVQNVAKKVINGKPTLAAVGNLSQTPYLDQLL